MRLAYLDCFAGIAGDMLLGALLDAGVPEHILHDATHALNLNASLRIERVDRSGITATKVHVLEAGQPAEPHPDAPEQPTHIHTHQPKTQHLHKSGHAHTHDEHTHEHDQARSLTTIRALIQAAPLAAPVQQLALRAFDLLGHAEATVHNVPLDHIHFHEVGAVDAIVDIVAASAGLHHLAVDAWHASPVNLGSGTVLCAHGAFPVPAPATAHLLRGIPTYAAHVAKELTTPTGAALLRALNPTFGPQPPMRVHHIGYGAGTRNPPGFPNVLRLNLGDTETTTNNLETVALLETALDDATPQLLAYVAEQALAQGALDVTLTPILMKKGRPGTLLTVLCHPPQTAALQQLILRETPTLGLRLRYEQRLTLDRHHQTVQTPYGPIRLKLGTQNNQLQTATPEYEDCKTAAQRHNTPLKTVQQAALTAFQNSSEQ